jgi:DNA-binding transcriptional regulator LsrR (DeoR family)
MPKIFAYCDQVKPPGAFAELEELIEHSFGLSQVIIGEAAGDSEEAARAAIGSAAAQFLESIMKSGDVIGISSWSASLLSTVNQMHPIRKIEKCLVVQVLAGNRKPVCRTTRQPLGCSLSQIGARRGSLSAGPWHSRLRARGQGLVARL